MADQATNKLAEEIQDAYAKRLGTKWGKLTTWNKEKYNELEKYFKKQTVLGDGLVKMLNKKGELFNNFFDNIVMNHIKADGTFKEEELNSALEEVNKIYGKLIAADPTLLEEVEVEGKTPDKTPGKTPDKTPKRDKQATDQLLLIMTDLLSEKLDHTELKNMNEALENIIAAEDELGSQKSIFNEKFNQIRSLMFAEMGVYQGFQKKSLSNLSYRVLKQDQEVKEVKKQLSEYINAFNKTGKDEVKIQVKTQILDDKLASEAKNRKIAFYAVKIAIVAIAIGLAVGASFLATTALVGAIAWVALLTLAIVVSDRVNKFQEDYETQLIKDLGKKLNNLDKNATIENYQEFYLAYKKVTILPDSEAKRDKIEKLETKCIEDLDQKLKALQKKLGKNKEKSDQQLYMELYIAYKKVTMLPDLEAKTTSIEEVEAALQNFDEYKKDKDASQKFQNNNIVQFFNKNPDLVLATLEEIKKDPLVIENEQAEIATTEEETEEVGYEEAVDQIKKKHYEGMVRRKALRDELKTIAGKVKANANTSEEKPSEAEQAKQIIEEIITKIQQEAKAQLAECEQEQNAELKKLDKDSNGYRIAEQKISNKYNRKKHIITSNYDAMVQKAYQAGRTYVERLKDLEEDFDRQEWVEYDQHKRELKELDEKYQEKTYAKSDQKIATLVQNNNKNNEQNNNQMEIK